MSGRIANFLQNASKNDRLGDDPATDSQPAAGPLGESSNVTGAVRHPKRQRRSGSPAFIKRRYRVRESRAHCLVRHLDRNWGCVIFPEVRNVGTANVLVTGVKVDRER